MTPDAEIVNVRFTKSVIASKAAFTYEEAQIRKDDPYVSRFSIPHNVCANQSFALAWLFPAIVKMR
jgi:exoribonuclease R